ncbi:unnamed protein product [Phyllotreta striolata]|uniref:Claspin n=1 Tax=Phyllotreta striolata TaxID=444603 RepID=A0A9N9TLG5_PHYSR|nr:unnamed protein product [Phyllotreta striolata]
MDNSDDSKFAQQNMENNSTVNDDDNNDCSVDSSIIEKIKDSKNVDDLNNASNKLLTDVTNNENANKLLDDTNEEELTKIKEKKRGNRKRILSLSDSDDELENESLVNNIAGASENEFEQNDVNHQEAGIRKSRKRITLIDSDSEDEPSIITESKGPSSTQADSSKANLIKTSNENPELAKWNLNFDDSDSDLENLITIHNKSFTETTSERPLSPENESIKRDRYNLSESSDDETNVKTSKRDSEENNSGSEKGYNSGNEIKKSIKYKRKRSVKNNDEPHEMTAREAVKQREEIRSETQRLVRESNISLPYHRPKSYTLKEFLARRPKFASAVPLATKTPPSIAMKMATEQLEVITKKLEERHKEVQEFYKSDSEHEDENDDEDYIPPGDTTSEADIKKADDNTNDISNNLDKNSDCEDLIEKYKAAEEGVNDLNNIDDKCSSLMDIDNEQIESKESTTENVQSNNSEQEIRTNENTSLTNIPAEDIVINKQSNDKVKIISDFLIKPPENEPNVADFDKTQSNNTNENNATLNNSDTSNNINNLSEDYEFNLDDIEDDTMGVTNDNQNTAGKLLDPEFMEIHQEIENSISDKPIVPKTTKSKLEIIKERFLNDRPRLSGSPNHLIDLDTVIEPNEVTKLMERFALHTAKKAHHKDKVKLNVVSVEQGGEIHNETVSVSADAEEIAIEEKPGVRLQRLRNELQSQIAQRKSEIWRQRAAAKDEVQTEIDPYDGEKSECGADDNILDDEEEDEMSESSDEEEIEEDLIDGKPRKKSEFLNDEADESDIEDNEENLGNDDNEEEGEGDTGSNEDDDNEVDEDNDEQESNIDENNEEQSLDALPFKKPLRRIIKAFTEDSDDEENAILPGETIGKIAEKLNKSNETDTNSTQDDYITPYQQQTMNKTPNKSDCTDPIFLTPVSYITGLQNLSNSASKANVPSPLRESDWHAELQKKLHTDSIITNSQAEAMKELCSDDFPVSQDLSNETIESSAKLTDLTGGIQIAPTNTQEILNICSGTFEESQNDGISSLPTANSNCINPSVKVALNAVEEVKSLDKDQDMIISQLLNEEELETFKKKFDSPVLEYTQRSHEEAMGGGGIIESDDDEEGILEVRKKKINQKKLTFSDDESSVGDDEERDLSDEEMDDAQPLPAEINYDSEENEVDYAEETEKKPLKAKDFFEDEAELSESEWGSDDEDEKDLDVLEFEQGDKDQFDNKKLRMDLEKIHMRRILDDDTRELLLDDGELHGSGRERQFRWKNVDSNFPAEDETRNSDDEAPVEEDDSEEQWRRRRHEREMFLKEKKSQQEDIEMFDGGEILKLGYRVITSSSSISQSSTAGENKTDASSSPAVKKAFGLLHKRGSFLSRGETMLKKLAEFNKLTNEDSDGTVKAGKKTSKNFLFQTVAREESPKSFLISSVKVGFHRIVLSSTQSPVGKGFSLIGNLQVDRRMQESSVNAGLASYPYP